MELTGPLLLWGALHGSYLCVERLFRKKESSGDLPLPEVVPVTVRSSSFAPAFFRTKATQNFFLALLTFFLVNVTWVFFRSAVFTTSWRLLFSIIVLSDVAAVLSTLYMLYDY